MSSLADEYIRDRGARGFLGRHVPARDPPSADGPGGQAGPVRHRHVARARRAHPAHHRRLRPREGHHHAGHPGGRQDDARRCSRPAGSAPRSTAWSARWASRARIGHAKKVMCVGGGLGVAPVFPQARAFKESGAYVIGVLGFRTRDLMFWEDKFRRLLRRVHRLHRRRLGGNQGARHRGHQARPSRSIRTSTSASRSGRRS